MKTFALLLCLCLLGRAAAAEYLYQYDAAGRLVSVSLPQAQTISYRYDAAGNIVDQAFAVLVDSDQDELPDDWELLHFESLAQGADDDPDGDGFTNLEEYLAGTDPNDELSLLRILELDPNPSGGTLLEVSSVPGRSYLIQSKDSLSDPAWLDRETAQATGSVLSWTDPDGGSATRFYRVVVVP